MGSCRLFGEAERSHITHEHKHHLLSLEFKGKSYSNCVCVCVCVQSQFDSSNINIPVFEVSAEKKSQQNCSIELFLRFSS